MSEVLVNPCSSALPERNLNKSSWKEKGGEETAQIPVKSTQVYFIFCSTTLCSAFTYSRISLFRTSLFISRV